MADISITAANVIPSAQAIKRDGTAGATITQGQLLYYDNTAGTMKLADSNGAGDLHVVAGIALNAAAAGQPVKYATSDPALVIGATVAIGDVLVASATPGGIAPAADLATGYFATVLGVAISVTAVNFNPTAAGAAKA